MTHYLLSVHTVDCEAREPMTEERMRESHQRLGAVEADLKATGAWVFSGRLDDPGAARVVRGSGGEVMTTDGPFAESKEHIGGFYVVRADSLDDALGWAARVSAAIDAPIEVRAFAGVEGS